MSNQRRNWKLAVGNRKSANSNMKASGLDLLFLEVNNLEESLGFYQGLLGLELESFNLKSDPPMATLRAGALKITLAEQLETMLRRGRGAHFFIGVEDVDSLYEEIREQVPGLLPPVDEGWGGRFITLQDPDKYRFFFVTWSDQTGPSDKEVGTTSR